MEKMLNLCSFEQAQRLKKAGFDWDVTDFYVENPNDFMLVKPVLTKIKWDELDTTNIYHSAPTVALALKWFRDEKGIRGFVLQTNRANYKIFADYDNGVNSGNYNLGYNFYNTYEAAESALLDELLTILEEN